MLESFVPESMNSVGRGQRAGYPSVEEACAGAADGTAIRVHQINHRRALLDDADLSS